MTSPAATTYRIAVIPGDGIGPEVIAAGRRVLDAVGERFGFAVEWREIVVGGRAIDTYGVPIRDEDLAICAGSDAVYLGAIGGPKWDDPNAAVRPEQALFALRGGLELFANLRPVTVEPALAPSSPLRPALLRGVDMLIVRELTSGLYFGRPSEERRTPEGRVGVDTLWYTEAEIRRVVRVAFELARGRRGRLTSVDKANVLATSRLWRKVVEEMRPDFPTVIVEHRLVDAAAMLLIQHPAAFDVIVTENLFGDILSDEASVLAGSLGMLPSASIGERRTAHGIFGLYEPIHGSAPDIAGQDRANPIGTILSGAMLLRWSLGRPEAAAAVEAAVRAALRAGWRTLDLVPSDGGAEGVSVVGTEAFTGAVIERLPDPVPAGAAR
ncbi:MAG: 3-isopropylmalate dehydrogenase, 3-isopropylmalate dehydrogenase [Chloroflexi bacterium CSP1-4]|nr:MAG: 3-isopropylmalate dehydrogenase, 3-isopropylmalate dehydrogenase [Chloroflexi bacterium CSP1-4]